MIPNIFVSSTIEDLQHLRESVRDTIADLGYTPVMSEYGEIGYLPDASAVDSCYIALRDCQLAVFIVGTRYGHQDDSGTSITHNEFRSARERKVPTIALVDRDVMAFKKVYDANKENPPAFPGMDAPGSTFRFVREISDSELNNGILAFRSASEARDLLKKQVALIFGDLLARRYDPLKAQVRDVLSEIKTLRHELVGEKVDASRQYLRAMRYLLSEDELPRYYRSFTENTIGDLEESVPVLLACRTFDEFVEKAGITLEFDEGGDFLKDIFGSSGELPADLLMTSMSKVVEEPKEDETMPVAAVAVFSDRRVKLNASAKKKYDRAHEEMVQKVEQRPN